MTTELEQLKNKLATQPKPRPPMTREEELVMTTKRAEPPARNPLLDLLAEVEDAAIAYLSGWEDCADHLVCLVCERIQRQNNEVCNRGGENTL